MTGTNSARENGAAVEDAGPEAADSNSKVHPWVNVITNHGDSSGSSVCSDKEAVQAEPSTSVKETFRQLTRDRSASSILGTTEDPYDDNVSWVRKTWILLEEPHSHPVALAVHYVYSVIIVLSVLSVVLETMDTLSEDAHAVLKDLELFFNTLFTLEVVARVVCAPQKTLLLRNMYMWMDVGAILPMWIVLIFGLEDTVRSNMYLELLGLLIPILRLLKITRHSEGWRILVQSIIECSEPLRVPALLMMVMTVIASCVIFWLEKHFSEDDMAFRSLPHAMWFAICTISTVGYGDVTPRSDLARSAAAMLILGGVCYMAMPLAIIGGTFVQVWQDREALLMRLKAKQRFAEGGVSPESLRELFEAADQDSSGAVKRSEFVSLVEAFKLGMSRAQIKKLFQSVDINCSGEITFDEFAIFLFPELDIPEDREGEEDDGQAAKHAPASNQERSFVRRVSAGSAVSRRGSWKSAGSMTSLSLEVQKWVRDMKLRKPVARQRRPPGEPHHARSHTASSLGIQAAPSAANAEMLDRVERLEIAVARLGVEQRRHFEAQQRILEDLAARIAPKPQSLHPFSSAPRFNEGTLPGTAQPDPIPVAAES